MMLRRSVAISAILAAVVLLAVGWIVFKSRQAAHHAGAPRAASNPGIKAPSTSSSNAADCYIQAAQLFAALGSADLDQVEQYESGGIDGRADEFFQRHAAMIGWVHRGSGQPECDWGQPAMEQRLPSLNHLRGIASLTWGHARFAEHAGNIGAAIDDLLSAIALARHIGKNGLLVDALVQIGIEGRSIEGVARILPKLSREQLNALARRLDALPRPITGQQLLLGEFDYAQRSIRQQQAGVVAVSMVDALKDFYTGLGDVIDTQSPDEFARTVDALLSEYKLNTFAQTAGPTYKRFREPMAAVQARRAMLRCAVEVQIEGESALARSRDPFGDGAPYTYHKTDTGFTLTSKLPHGGNAVSLTVGGQ
jgi:hypothetical protein